ncbi:hypothetical protein LAZ67_3002683 [Cordylochernes scorpioides]|uniref:Uncharacterized protein n=1 Tax=Cordylochernes scorpioides TaxID=51811 RepID=A0ABY6K830_9ARAC|nr:hypothetical protein LAZ67_3002683 [Cordylochernes scorpioides]
MQCTVPLLSLKRLRDLAAKKRKSTLKQNNIMNFFHELGVVEGWSKPLVLDRYDPGSQSFDDLRTVDDIVCSTSKDTDQSHGFMADDFEWYGCLFEVALFEMPYHLR